MNKKILSEKKYVESIGLVCPNCHSEAVVGEGQLEVESQMAFQKIKCEDCNCTWIDEYKLVGYSDLENERGDKLS